MQSLDFSVLSLNLAHGRGRGWHQAFSGRRRIAANLDAVAAVIRREEPDVVGLQEADGHSLWSGRFDHVAYLRQASGLSHGFRGEHVGAWRLSYGTALVSRWPIENPSSHKFTGPRATPAKGLVQATVRLRGEPACEIDIASLHLDFMHPGVRRRQAAQTIERLSARTRPLVLMGDFNCSVRNQRDALELLIERLELRAWLPEAIDQHTFPLRRARLDWILVSREIEFVEYGTLPDRVSDHLAVRARLRMTALHSQYETAAPRA